MIAKLSLTLLLLVATATARPDKPALTGGYNYQAPARSFSHRQRYQDSPEDTYEAPASPEQTYDAPDSLEVTYNAPSQTYQEPASPEDTYEAPDSPEQIYSAPAQPQRTYSAPAQPQRAYSAPVQPQRAYSAPAQPQRAYSAPAQRQRAYSAPSPTYSSPEDSEEDLPLMPFDFGYIVDDSSTENAYGHKSNSDGEQVTGQYRVLLPDGRTQIVTYKADKENGFQAEVTYEGEARPWVPPTSVEQTYQAPPTKQGGYA